MTARERIDRLFDTGSFEEVDKLVTHRCRDFGMDDQIVPGDGVAVYSPAITDFIVMVRDTSYMFVTGPDVITTVTHEHVTKEELGGAMTHNATSGVAHFAVEDDGECLSLIRELLSFMPSNNLDDLPRRPTADPRDREDPALDRLVPDVPN